MSIKALLMAAGTSLPPVTPAVTTVGITKSYSGDRTIDDGTIAWTGSAVIYAVGSWVYRSLDGGATWSNYASPSGNTTVTNSSVASNGAGVVVLSQDFPNAIYRSTDHGATWSTTSNVDSGSIKYVSSRFIVYGQAKDWVRPFVKFSTDNGVTWTTSYIGSGWASSFMNTRGYTGIVIDVAYYGGKYIAQVSKTDLATYGVTYTTFTSSNGTTWTEVTPTNCPYSTDKMLELSTTNVVVLGSDYLYSTSDGVTWTKTANNVAAAAGFAPTGVTKPIAVTGGWAVVAYAYNSTTGVTTFAYLISQDLLKFYKTKQWTLSKIDSTSVYGPSMKQIVFAPTYSSVVMLTSDYHTVRLDNIDYADYACNMYKGT